MAQILPRRIVLSCLRRILGPVVGFCLRHGITIQDFIEIGKRQFVEGARGLISGSGDKVNISRVSVLTGLRRREVQRLTQTAPDVDEDSCGLMTKVIGRWLTDRKFIDNRHAPKVLSVDGENSEFRSLVFSVSRDVGAGTVLSELMRVNAVKLVPNGAKLLVEGYEPKGDPESGFDMLGSDVHDLIAAVEENIFAIPELSNLHATTEYTNISSSKLPALRKWLLTEGMAFHKRARDYISGLDYDLNPRTKGKDRFRVVLGSFSRISKRD